MSIVVFLRRNNDRHRPDNGKTGVFPRERRAMTPGNNGFPHIIRIVRPHISNTFAWQFTISVSDCALSRNRC
ncbi:MAG: hypothetical protein KF800_12635 [Lysobacter sp.]|nr:hypothetical protein [Lysobacter sp.]